MTGLPKVTVNVSGLITRSTTNTDGVTGFIFYNDNIADLTTFTSSNRIIKFTNLSAIEATGITATSNNFKAEHYQLKEFFRSGGNIVYVGIFEDPTSAYDYTESDTMKLFSQGEIKIYAIYNPQSEFDKANVGAIQTILDEHKAVKKPAIAIYSADFSTTTLSALADLRNLTSDCPDVSVVCGVDMDLTTPYVNLGCVAGALSNASVSTNILNTGVYNYSDASQMVNVGFYVEVTGTPTKVYVKDLNETDLDTLNDKGYIFWRYLPNLQGTYLSNDNNSTKITNTFNSIHINRVVNKVIRQLDGALSSLIGSTVLFNTDGTMRPISAKVYEDAARSQMNFMKTNGEISQFDVFVDPTQNVLSTKTVTVNVSIVPTESADYITVDVAFVSAI